MSLLDPDLAEDFSVCGHGVADERGLRWLRGAAFARKRAARSRSCGCDCPCVCPGVRECPCHELLALRPPVEARGHRAESRQVFSVAAPKSALLPHSRLDLIARDSSARRLRHELLDMQRADVLHSLRVNSCSLPKVVG